MACGCDGSCAPSDASCVPGDVGHTLVFDGRTPDADAVAAGVSEADADADDVTIFKALGNEYRLRALDLLRTGEKCACDLLGAIDVSQPNLSHHMKVLCASGIVRARQEGRWTYYAIDERGGHVYANDLFKLAENRPEKWSRGQVRRALREAGVKNTREARRGGRSILYLPDHCSEDEAKTWGTVPPQRKEPQ